MVSNDEERKYILYEAHDAADIGHLFRKEPMASYANVISDSNSTNGGPLCSYV